MSCRGDVAVASRFFSNPSCKCFHRFQNRIGANSAISGICFACSFIMQGRAHSVQDSPAKDTKRQKAGASHGHTSIPNCSLPGPIPTCGSHGYSSFSLPSLHLVLKSFCYLICNLFLIIWVLLVESWDWSLNSQKLNRLPSGNRPAGCVSFARQWEVLYDKQYARQYEQAVGSWGWGVRKAFVFRILYIAFYNDYF